eukprot:TRINITY_DN1271_c5_g1_i1.p2 TRINITY_DN1271_c5_g1~~TRINITY_DN1271_c5_g1_i1.p2  ORF type:complete len:130 (-),score=2.44 TRINITY_DN1271_c5_g1_i1:25-414(-)
MTKLQQQQQQNNVQDQNIQINKYIKPIDGINKYTKPIEFECIANLPIDCSHTTSQLSNLVSINKKQQFRKYPSKRCKKLFWYFVFLNNGNPPFQKTIDKRQRQQQLLQFCREPILVKNLINLLQNQILI